MVLPTAASAALTGFGPMLQPLPSTSEYTCSVTLGSGSPTLIIRDSPKDGGAKTKTTHIVGRFPGACRQRGSDFDGLFDQTGRDPVLGLGDRPALGDLDHVTGVV